MRNRLKALIWLRGQIILSNKTILLQVILPFGFAYLYKYIYSLQGTLDNSTKQTLLVTCLALALSLSVGNPLSTIISEEKEKNTLRTLLLSGVTSLEYLLSTLLFPLLIGLLAVEAMPRILDLDQGENYGTYALVGVLTTLVLMLIYLFIGLSSKSQVASQVISLPVTMLTLFIPMLSGLSQGFDRAVTYSYMGLFTKALKGLDQFSWDKQWLELVTLLIWLLIFALLNVLQTKRLRRIQ